MGRRDKFAPPLFAFQKLIITFALRTTQPYTMIKRILSDILDYLKYQVDNDKCTPEEMKSIHDAIVNNVNVEATVQDIATHYGQSESNVRNVIARRITDRPKRRVHYNLARVIRHIPKSWRRVSTAKRERI